MADQANPLDGFVLTVGDIDHVGVDLQRPECILAEPDGTLWSANARGGVVRIDPDGAQQLITQAGSTTFTVVVELIERIAQGFARRQVPIGTFYTGPGETCLRAGELVVEVVVPAAALLRTSHFAKLALYSGDFPTASVLLSVRREAAGAWTDVRLVLGAMAATPIRLRRTEARLAGRLPTVAQVRTLVDHELDRIAHPLPGNVWKLDAAAGLVEHAVEAILVS